MTDKNVSMKSCLGCKWAQFEIPAPYYAKPPNAGYLTSWAMPIQCTCKESKLYRRWLNLNELNGDLVPRIVTKRCKYYEFTKDFVKPKNIITSHNKGVKAGSYKTRLGEFEEIEGENDAD
jgi:hypothetical protein